MAIPFNLPTDEETEDTYRRIDQLLLDLYDLLREIIFRQRAIIRDRAPSQVSSNSGVSQPTDINHNLAPTAPTVPSSPQSTQIVSTAALQQLSTAPTSVSRLPDVVADSLPLVRKAHLQRRRRRRQEKTILVPTRRQNRALLRHATPYDDVTNRQIQAPAPNWLNVGVELRQIAEEITFFSRNGNNRTTKRRNEIKASSLFSLLVPAPISGTIWTTVIILVGWRLLTKHR